MRAHVFVLLLLVSSACTHQDPGASGSPAESEDGPGDAISIMTFNVENLFDTAHDQGKDDYTFLPLASKDNQPHRDRCNLIEVRRWREQCLDWDWSERALTYKLNVIAEVIQQENNGRGPDIIAFQEIENVAVLNRLRTQFLPQAGYAEPVLVEGNDLRGIDVAFLTRLPVVGKPVLHPIEFRQISERRRADTRGILQTDFRLPDGGILTGYAVHFPAPFHPYELRIDAYETLNRLVDCIPDDRPVFAAGDFNTPSAEDREHRLLDRHAKARWTVTHEEHCQNCRGTSYYPPKEEWSFLDMILVRRSSDRVGSWTLDPMATRLVNDHPQQQTERGYPRRFQLEPLSGVSDHWPLMIELRQNPPTR